MRCRSLICLVGTSLAPLALVGCFLFGDPATSSIPAGFTDANGNGLADSWEAEYGVSDPNADEDHDGLKNSKEFEIRSDPRVPNSALPVFPGAEGFGAYGFGGRGPGGVTPKIFRVTTLQDRVADPGTGQLKAAPGSLREAIEASGPRFVVFNVGGTIVCDDEISITNPYITIAGQTAPSPGIVIAHHGIKIHTSDVVIRGIRIRVYFDENKDWTLGRNMDCVTSGRNDYEIHTPEVDAISNLIFDHCSFAWACDENFDTWNWVRNYTVQYCIIAEGSLYGSDYGPQSYGWLGGRDPASTDPGNQMHGSIHHNFFAQNAGRIPQITDGSAFDFRNNVVYNWNVGPPVRLQSSLKINFVRNYYIAGLDPSNVDVIRNVITVPGPFETSALPRIFLEGNLGPRRGDNTLDNWALGVAYYRLNTGNYCSNVASNQYCNLWVTDTNEKEQFDLGNPALTPPVTTQDAPNAKDLVLQKAGCTAPVRDAVDAAVVNEVNYVLGTNAFGRGGGYNAATDPQIHHVGANWGPVFNVLLFKPANDPNYACLPRMYRIRPGQTELAAKLELLSRLSCTFADGISLPGGAAQVIANPAVYQWETVQYHIPDLATIQGLYPASGPGPADSDGDGIPNDAEIAMGTDPNVFDSLGDKNGDGYLNIENYVNGLIP